MTSGLAKPVEGVEHRLRPRAHLLALAAGQVAEFLAADRVQRPEDDDLAVGATLENGFEAGGQRERRLTGTRLAAERDDADALVEQQIERDALFGGTSVQPERLTFTAHQLNPLVGSHPAQRARRAAEESNTGVARQFSRLVEVDDTLGEQLVDGLAATSSSVMPVQPDGTTS